MTDLALFDFDGTITDRDTFTPFLFSTVGARRLALGRVVLAPFVIAFRLHLLPSTAMRQIIVAFGLRGRAVAAVDAAGAVFAREQIPAWVRPEARARLAWHKARGDRIVVVSASLAAYLRPWCAAEGLELICVELEERSGMLTGHYRGGDCSAHEKARRVRERYDLSQFATIYAYGDTVEDRELFALAHLKSYQWAEPTPSIAAIAMAKRIR
jgi:HAD superfamily hydrolase (TIGR01490 family)